MQLGMHADGYVINNVLRFPYRMDYMERWEDAMVALPSVRTNQHAKLDMGFAIGLSNGQQILHWGFAVNARERQEV